MSGGNEAAAPHPRRQRLDVRLVGVGRRHHHEGREVLVQAPEAIREPGPEARAARQLIARVDGDGGGLVVDGVGVERLDDSELVDDFRGPGEELAHPRPALPVLGEGEEAGRDRVALLPSGHPGQALVAADRSRQLLAEHVAQLGLVVPGIELRRRAGRKEPDGATRPRSEMRQVRQAVDAAGEHPRAAEHRGDRDRADAPSGLAQELAPGHRQIVAAGAARGTCLRVHLLSASSRFRNRLPTMVHAASSAAGIDAFATESPRATSAFDALRSAA